MYSYDGIEYYGYPINFDRTEYYNYTNNNYNQPLYTENANSKKINDPYKGFISGNMFPNLYNGYKIKPLDIKPINEQAKLLTNIDSLCFALIDMNLYLDLFPNDKDILEQFNQYRSDLNMMMEEYQNKYGPIILNSDANNKYPFVWIKNPWPWEN